MKQLEELPDVEREILRLLFFSEDYSSTPVGIAERCYYPNTEVYEATRKLEAAGHIISIQDRNGNLFYKPNKVMISIMMEMSMRASLQLRNAVEEALKWGRPEQD